MKTEDPVFGSLLTKNPFPISACLIHLFVLDCFGSKVQPPVGFWDPLGLSSDGDVAVFKRRREVELKHGRSQSRMMPHAVAGCWMLLS